MSRNLEGYSQDAGSENWESGGWRLVRRPCGKPEGLVTELRNVLRRTRERCRVARSREVTWIAGRGRWSRYGESPRRRNVRDGGCEGNGAVLPRRDLRAVAVPGEFCVIKNRLRAKFKDVSCHPTADLTNP